MMRSRWGLSLPITLAAALLVIGVASTLIKPSNPAFLPTGLNVAANAESTALYCTGLSNGAAGVAGQVTFLNTTDAPRTLVLYVVSDTHARTRRTLRLAAHASASVRPDKIVAGNGFAVAALIDGGGVVAEEVTSDRSAETPCVSAGVTDWYASGFDTLVGSNGSLSIYNPTATPAVLNVTAFTTTGFVAPPSFQGLAVGAHQQLELNLGDQIVNATNIGVRVRVLRGSLAIIGVQRSGRVVSLNPGSAGAAVQAWFPRVTTVARAVAQIRIANPGPSPAVVTLDVKLPPFAVKPWSITVAPFSSDQVVVTPNPAIPAAGYATVQLTSSEAVVATLATGTRSGVALSPAQHPGTTFLLTDFTGAGYNTAAVTNTSSHPITVTFTKIGRSRHTNVTDTARLAGNSTSLILGLFSGLTSFRSATLLVTTSRPSLLVTATLPSSPVGVTVVSPLYGG